MPQTDDSVKEVPRSVSDFVNHIRTYLDDAGHAATKETTPEKALKELRAVAALCVACFEQHGCPVQTGRYVENKRDGATRERGTHARALPSKRLAAVESV
jgi:hypothetical protein